VIRILIVDDSSSVRLHIRMILESDPELQVIGEARNGEESVALCRKLQPDIVTMDIQMPVMDGYEAIGRIMSECPCPILVLTGIESREMVHVSFKALALGALSVLPKASLSGSESDTGRELIREIKLMAGIKVVRRRLVSGEDPSRTAGDLACSARFALMPRVNKGARLVAIGASTGGPPALQVILGGLPPDFPLPIVIVQHISIGFSTGLASWLSQVTPFRCKLGEYGEMIKPGTVYIAPDSKQMSVHKEGVILLDASAPARGHCPSVDILFESVARNFGGAAVGILLTGMGRDGARGLKAMRQAGAYTIAQNEKSSVVFSMPAAAIELEAADEVLDLNHIAPRLSSLVEP
jgi:two-component system, chemotaxis family, protein-glutamate methylesterase/glutaminase